VRPATMTSFQACNGVVAGTTVVTVVVRVVVSRHASFHVCVGTYSSTTTGWLGEGLPGGLSSQSVPDCGAKRRYFIVTRLCQKFLRLSVPPNRVVKFVESTMTMSPARWPVGGIQISALNSVLPASVKGWGRFGSTR
jgi:hypothetical protein